MAAQQDRQVGPGYNVPSSAKVNPSFFGHVAPARSGTPPTNPQAVKYYVTPGGTVTYRPNDVPPPQGSAEISAEQYQDSAGTIERSQSYQAMLKLNLEHAGFTDVKVSPAMVSYSDRRGMAPQQPQGYSREAPTVQFSE
jgi:hypothetical protein